MYTTATIGSVSNGACKYRIRYAIYILTSLWSSIALPTQQPTTANRSTGQALIKQANQSADRSTTRDMGRLWQTVGKAALWLPVGITVNSLLLSVASVKGRSMQPTLNEGLTQNAVRDRVLLDKFSVQIRHRYQRGDVVILASPEAAGERLIKRLVALEGDVVTDRRGKARVIPPGRCWVEGDNPDFSDDSDKFGAVPLALIESRVLAVVWPPDRMKRVRRALPEERVNV